VGSALGAASRRRAMMGSNRCTIAAAFSGRPCKSWCAADEIEPVS
jgi:hypothetical protein